MSRADTFLEDRGLPILDSWFFEEDALVYQGKNASELTVDAIVGPEKTERRQSATGDYLLHVRNVKVKTSELASPEMNASVTVGGFTYNVAGIGPALGGVVDLELTRAAVEEFSRPNYRG